MESSWRPEAVFSRKECQTMKQIKEMRIPNRIVDVEAGYGERIKNMLRTQSVQVSPRSSRSASVVCLTFQRQVSRSLFDLRVQMVSY